MRRTDQQSDRDGEGLLYRRGGRTVEEYPGCRRKRWMGDGGWMARKDGWKWMDGRKNETRRELRAAVDLSLE